MSLSEVPSQLFIDPMSFLLCFGPSVISFKVKALGSDCKVGSASELMIVLPKDLSLRVVIDLWRHCLHEYYMWGRV